MFISKVVSGFHYADGSKKEGGTKYQCMQTKAHRTEYL